MIGMGLLLSSGDLWKKKRRVLNEVFHHDFMIRLIPHITSLCDEGLEKMELQSRISEKSFRFNVADYIRFILSNVVFESFFGKSVKNEKLNGLDICDFMLDLNLDITEQCCDPLYYIFGKRYLDLEFTDKRRNLNKKLKKYKEWGINFIRERLEEIREEHHNKEPTNIIEAIERYRKKGCHGC